MKRIFTLLLPATIILVGQYGCSSSNSNNPPANTSSTAQQVSDSPPANKTNTMPSPPANQAGAKNADSMIPDLVMQYSQLYTAEMKNDRAKVDSLLAANYQEKTGDGKTLNKEQTLAQITPDRKFDTYSLDNLKSTINGDNGTVTGRASVIRSGKTESWQFTCTMKKENGKWMATETKITDYKKS